MERTEKNSDTDILVALVGVLDRRVVLELDCTSEPPGQLLKPQTAGPYPQFLIRLDCEMEPGNLHV